jgi:Holliday junction resolvase RusA-like endonuclease
MPIYKKKVDSNQPGIVAETHTIPIKPMSVNQAWQGKRYKTPEYKRYEATIIQLLPCGYIPTCKLKMTIEAGFSNSNSDIDNVIKPFLDILQKKYGFNDRQVYEIVARKLTVKRGQEYIKWRLEKHD